MLLVFPVLAAKYENLLPPLSIILIVPMGLLSAISALVALLAACTSPEPVQEAKLATPDTWTRLSKREAALAGSTSIEIEQAWRKSFNDPALDRLIGRALENNKTLQIAAARVAEAEAGLSGANANLLANISGSGGVSRGNQGYATSNQSVSIKEGYIQASWELDLNQSERGRHARLVRVPIFLRPRWQYFQAAS